VLISYPILPTRQAAESEEAYFERIVREHVIPTEGHFPISTLNAPGGAIHRWHGGVHLVGNGEPIRAIADGTVVAFRVAAQLENYPQQGDYDTSFVLLRHDTHTGENTRVEFYSLYMHLAFRDGLASDRVQQLPQWLRQATPGPNVQRPTNTRLLRKDVLGFAGVLYDHEACHVEIFATDTAFTRFWRDSTAVTQGDGSADFFGDAHVVIPQGQAFVAAHPSADAQNRLLIQNSPGTVNDVHYQLPAGQAGTSSQQLFVSIRLERGQRVATSFVANAAGLYDQLGQPVTQDDYEHELFRLATVLYPDCPSAGYEKLRFGRVLGPETTTTNQNWQLVRFSATEIGYIDLAPTAIAKLSDADFVHWQGWERRDEGQTANSADGLCDDQRTITLCQAGDAESQKKVQHLICKAPSEWDAADLAVRYARLREPGRPLEQQDAWDRFEAHVQRMAFWSAAQLGDRSVWHFHPLRFIAHYRKCAWLHNREMLQLIPVNVIRKPGSHTSTIQSVWEQPDLAAARGSLNVRAVDLNKALRKFNITSRIRQACFFGNSTQETAWFRYMEESDGRQPNLHLGWYGRGFLQLTNPDGDINGGNNNYYKYFEFLGRNPRVPPGQQEVTWRGQIATSAHHAAQSAAAYWVWPNKSAPTTARPNRPQVDSANRYADVPEANQRRVIATNRGNKVWYYNQSFTDCAAAVNYPGTVGSTRPSMNGLVDRSTAFVNALIVLTDTPTFPSAANVPQPLPENFDRQNVP
jgi:hypothetical protein